MQALQNIRVIDLSFTAPGTFCTMLLADFGAEVIKVEATPANPGRTDGTGKSPSGVGDVRNAAFYAPNRGKKSLALNLKSADGLRIFLKLARSADVIVEGFRPGVVRRLGIGYDSVSRENPRLVYCSISGYGQTGPYAQFPGHDINYISIGGALGLIGESGRGPAIPQNMVGDFAGGSLFATTGILMALLARQHTGRGQFVDASITDGVTSLLTWLASMCFPNGKAPQRGANAVGGGYPYYGVYETRDYGYISIACLEDRFWKNLCSVLGMEQYAQYSFDRRHHTESADGTEWAEVRHALEGAFRSRTMDEWFEVLTKADVPAARVNSLMDLENDPQMRHRDMVVVREHPVAGRVTQIGVALKLSETPGKAGGFPPLLGDHTDTLLAEMGYNSGDIARLRETGVVA